MHNEYSVITPFLSAGSGGDHVMFISLWVKLDTSISAGGPEGAEMRNDVFYDKAMRRCHNGGGFREVARTQSSDEKIEVNSLSLVRIKKSCPQSFSW
jgi:hypothetical protein